MTTKTEALKLALESAYLAGFNASGEGYNGEYPFDDVVNAPVENNVWKKDRDNYVKEALAQLEKTVTFTILTEPLSTVNPELYRIKAKALKQELKEALAQPDNISKMYEELRSIIDGGSESFTHEDAVQYLKDVLAQPEQNLNCKSVQARLATAWGYVKAEQEPVKIAHKHQWFRTGEMKVGQMRCISCGTWGQEDRPQQPKNQKQRPFTKKQRDTLCTVYAISSASTTANSLPNIAKIVNELLTEDLEVQPKEPEQEPVGTVGDLFDERVISKRELDRDFLVYIAQPKENT